ncbi:MAG: glycosyltransferase family 9 protein [Pirellulales bacterium]
MEQILFTNWRAPDDIVCMSACIRDLVASYPEQYEIHVAGSNPSLWENNPYISKVWGPRPPCGIPNFRLNCVEQLVESGRVRLHYITAFHRNLQSRLGIELPVLHPKGDLHLSNEERAHSLVEGRYWLVVAGWKADMPARIWSVAKFQHLVSLLRNEGINCVQGGALLTGHRHPHLTDVESFVGKTDLRGFLRLVYHADGVICPVTFAMHAAAAFDKPCVVIAGGRESWWWEAYLNSPLRHFGEECASVLVPHRFLHSIGELDCCRITGCWKTHVVPHELVPEASLCELPVDDSHGQTIPRCLDGIRVSDVMAAVTDYINAGETTTEDKWLTTTAGSLV